MLSPSDFNNAVPQFTNGNYASNPINPQYIAEPDAVSYNRGTEPLQTLPAQWWNWFLNKFTGRFNKVNVYVKNIFNELAQVLSIFNITPDGTEATPTTSQLKTVFETCYPQYVKTAACLVGTETTVNGHPLSSNVTVTRSDLGLGTSATLNTGTAVGCIPTVGTALGTTDNNILVTDSTGKLKPSGITVGTAAGCAATFFAKKTELDALYGNVVGTALGTAAVGTCTTFARSDHVHPSCASNTFVVDSPSMGNWNEGIRINATCGTATLTIGGCAYSCNGCTGTFLLGTTTTKPNRLYVTREGSWANSYFECTGANNGTVRWHGDVCGTATGSICSNCVYRNNYSSNYTFHLALFNGTSEDYTPMYVSNICPLTFNNSTGVLTANCFCGTASLATCATQSAGNFLINAQAGSYNEGLRINRSNTGYANIMLGTTDGDSGSCGGFWIGTNMAICGCRLYINYDNYNKPSYFQGTADGTVYWNGNVCGTVTEANCSQAIKFIENAWCGFCAEASGSVYCCVCNKCNFGIIASLGYLGLLAIPAKGKCNLGAYVIGACGNGIRCY